MSLPTPKEKPTWIKFCVPWVIFSVVTVIIVNVLGTSWWTIVLVPLLFCFTCQSSITSYNRRILAVERVYPSQYSAQAPLNKNNVPASSKSSSIKEELTAQTTFTNQPPAQTQKTKKISKENPFMENNQMQPFPVRYCPACGAMVQRTDVCEFCGSQLNT